MNIRAIVVSSVMAWGALGGAVYGAETTEPPVMSLLGEALPAVEIAPDARAKMEQQLAEAKAAYEQDTGSENAAIWYGRRLAYLGHYREAIGVFTKGLEEHPGSPKLLRHRGHRYITVREFDKAIADLKLAAQEFVKRKLADDVEEDGQPNAMNVPRSTLHGNIYYHLGMAYYLQGDFGRALSAFRTANGISANDDTRVASWNWMMLAGARWADHNPAREGPVVQEREWIKETVSPYMEIFENDGYHALLMYDAGKLSYEHAMEAKGGEVDRVTREYGMGARLWIEGKHDEARKLWEGILERKNNWAAFGYIAAEAEMARLRKEDENKGREGAAKP
ncbi:MAG TPA: hypothetical protein VG797_10365 [Phycisphaerales bacterium]|nr:hypothetical protein [Phycisphaerales bacterium]